MNKITKNGLLWTLCCAMLCAAMGKSWAAETPLRVACVGDSITFGAGVSDKATKAYPVLLGQWLGPKWDVQNFGASGATLLKKGNLPYWNRPHFKKALAFKPDVAVILFGANDSKHGAQDNPKIADNWQYKADFANDYKALLAEFRHVNPGVKLFLCLPVPAFALNRYGIDGAIIQNEIVPLVRQVATQSDAKIIDLHSPFGDNQKLFRDRVHPNDAGTRLMAAQIYRALSGQEAPTEIEIALAQTIPAPINLPTAPETLTTAVGTPTVTTPPVKENFHIYLLMGQSNMAGRDTRNLAAQVDNPRVLALNAEGKWIVARDPLHPKQGRTEPGAGPGISFALEMLKADPKITIGLIPCAVGGSALRSWVKSADYYEKALSWAKVAAQTGVIKGILWHQGESDTSNQKNADTYEARLTKMLGDLRADLGQPNLPVVVGQLGDFLAQTPETYPYAETVRAAIKHILTEVPDTGYADSAGLEDKGDKLHFSADAARELGHRFARAMQTLQKK